MANSLLASVAVVLLVGTAASQLLQRPPQDCVPGNPTSLDLFPQQFQIISAQPAVTTQFSTTVQVAQDFNVQYFNNYKVVTNLLANETYVLFQCGTPQPTVAGATKYFQIPLYSIATADDTATAFLGYLGVDDRIAYASEYAVAPCPQKLADTCGYVANTPGSSYANQTLLAQQMRGTDAVLVSAAQNDSTTIAFSASQDPGTLARAEWIKFLAVFFNMELEANSLFAQWNASFVNQTSNVAAVQGNSVKPIVAFIQNTTYPSDGFQVSFAVYKNQYIQAAGGQTLDHDGILAKYSTSGLVSVAVAFAGPSTDLFINATGANRDGGIAVVQEILSTVDVLIDETYSPTAAYGESDFLTAYSLTAADSTKYAFLKNSAVYREDGVVSPAGGSDWLEGAIARPDLVLADFVLAITPAAAPAGDTLYWLRNVATGTSVTRTGSSCTLLQGCQLTEPTPICPYAYVDCVTGKLVSATPANRCAPADCSANTTSTNTTTASNSTQTRPSQGNSAAGRPVAVVSALLGALLLLLAL